MNSAKKKTESFIETYIVPGRVGKGDGLYRMVSDSRGTNKKQIADAILKLDYSDFLKTKYWHLVALQVKNNAGWRCSSCGRHSGLVAHHPYYDLHGYEMFHIKDLQCLCRECHERLHGLRA